MSLVHSLNFVANHPINRDHRARALLRVLKWQIGSRLAPGEIVFKWVDESRFIVRRGETGLTGNVYCGLHEFSEMAFVLHALAPGDCFVDVGANVGSYTILASSVRQAVTHAFEPVPSTFLRLASNVRLNDLAGRVTLHNCGVSEEEGELLFSSAEDCANHVVAAGEDCDRPIRVAVAPLDALLQGASATLVKIDVEGFETHVIRGAQQTLRDPALQAVIMELNGSGDRYGFRDADLRASMAALGFLEYAYEPFTRALTRADDQVSTRGNSIFIRDVKEVARRVGAAPRFHVLGHAI
jgi:FkbM family methyltransferase